MSKARDILIILGILFNMLCWVDLYINGDSSQSIEVHLWIESAPGTDVYLDTIRETKHE